MIRRVVVIYMICLSPSYLHNNDVLNKSIYSYVIGMMITVLLLINHITIVDSIKCLQDQRIFTQTDDEGDDDPVEVDWWFAIKIRGTSDAYLYYDSTMDETEFSTGYFLRSDKSALGATMDQISSTQHYYVAFNDQPAKTMGDAFKINTHEKGIIAWDKEGGDGFYLMHTMPQFPNTYFSPLDGNPSHMYWQDSFSEGPRKSDSYAKSFPSMGWENNFFHNNLMSLTDLYEDCYREYHQTAAQKKASDKYNYGEDDSVEEDTSDSEDSADTLRHEKERAKKQQLCKLDISPFLVEGFPKKKHSLDLSHLIGGDTNPFAKLLDENVPAQHMFCLTLPDANELDPEAWTCLDEGEDPPSSVDDSDLDPPSMIQLFLQSLARGSTNGLSTTHKNVDDATEQYLLPQANQHAADYYKRCIQLNDKHYYFVVSSKSRQSDGSLGSKFSDIWGVLEEPGCDQTQIANRPCLNDNEQMWISTWRGSGDVDATVPDRPGDHLNMATFKAVVDMGGHEQSIYWGSTDVSVSGVKTTGDSTGGFSDHSKIGYLQNEGEHWDICLSGGNLHVYNKKTTKYTGSNAFLVCFKSIELSVAFDNLNVGANNNAVTRTKLWEHSQYYVLCSKSLNANIQAVHDYLRRDDRALLDDTHYDNNRLKANPPKRNLAAFGDRVNLFMPVTLLNMILEADDKKVEVILPSSSSSSSSSEDGGGGGGGGDDDEMEEEKSDSDSEGKKKKKKSSSSSSGSGSGSSGSSSGSGSGDEEFESEDSSSSSTDGTIIYFGGGGGAAKRKPPPTLLDKKEPPKKKQKKSLISWIFAIAKIN
ncbi:hypothetical protein DFA_02792 [Cavenderia fasciculata]|uniref:Uncharacterized protein n=1 Tax=Cavenderia fasciculata TaxID=261658 RepID=F4PIB5_CACFS|nr:uncharacterized protein DFA_02792 [Cavenderia fasciculata]EGG24549.1 hypothetical protein DFA_02792 [Cavenderia fasciculata]|eukprot:XP_004362400.1 hypothetical protein DFA_02792 [Cavenderia fasciculata]